MTTKTKKTLELTEAPPPQFEMNFNDGIPCEACSLHSSLGAPFPAEKTISQAKMSGIELRWNSDGMYFKFRSKWGIIPAANVNNILVTQ